MDLASIHSKEEEDRALALADGLNTWLGMKDALGQTSWVDGTPVDYTNWSTGQPSAESTGGCVHFYKFAKMKWHEWACIFKHQYLCSYEVTSPNKDCAVVVNGEWKATDCAERYPFACSD